MLKYSEYESAVRDSLWEWADNRHAGELDGGGRLNRPPVLAKRFASENLLLPDDDGAKARILDAVPVAERHRWFHSLKSSQALAQSVFGAIQAFDRLDLLAGIPAEDGRPAFFDDHQDWSLNLEHSLNVLREPRPTSIDVLLRGRGKRVAVECKFMEREFGMCSRPGLRPDDPKYDKQFCDGNYRVQSGRSERCSLSEIGVQYWKHLPKLFDWPADQDHLPCPFRENYQLARNALAATVNSDEELDAASGHALVLYDARNPEFQPGGKAHSQYQSTTSASQIPGLLRRLSWQKLLTALAQAPELTYLTENLKNKYGIVAGDHLLVRKLIVE